MEAQQRASAHLLAGHVASIDDVDEDGEWCVHSQK
jgi:hypothetical protein